MSLVIPIFLALTSSNGNSFEPDKLPQWQYEKYRTVFGIRGIVDNNRPVQVGKPEDGSPATMGTDVEIQFRLFENPHWANFKTDFYHWTSLRTHEDVADAVQLTFAMGLTFWDTIGFDLGHIRELNIGTYQPERGRKHTFAGARYLLLKDKILGNWDAYARLWATNGTVEISNKINEEESLLGEFGLRFSRKVTKILHFNLAPYAFIGKNSETRYGIYPGVSFKIPENGKSLPNGLSLGLNSHFGNGGDRSVKEVWIELRWEIK